MATDERAGQIGELIRQLRRQRNITQTELGATRYSKSYVSAVEKNTIRSSPEALMFFAEQLDQPRNYFISLLTPPEGSKQVDVLPEAHATNDQLRKQDESTDVLSLLLERMGRPKDRAVKALPPLATEIIATLGPSEQANYFWFEGMEAQEKQEYEAALRSFERALPLASAQLQPAVLDALGENHFLTRSYATALYYHQRALATLLHAGHQEPESTLLFPVALHCGEDYRILGAYTQARDMYERARTYLRADHEMKSAALLYLGWGYCTYALAYQAAQLPAARERGSLEEVEHGFQRAIKFIEQSRDLSQASGDHLGETTARLLLAETKLDFSTARSQLSDHTGTALAARFTLIDDAEEQCHQILVSSQDMLKHQAAPKAAIIYEAVAYLMLSFNRRAVLARLSGQVDKAMQERALATYLCHKALDALDEPSFPQTLLQAGLSVHSERPVEDAPALPRLPELTEETPTSRTHLPGCAEVYCAIGEVAEELGRTASSHADARNCYAYTDRYFDTALTLAHTVVSIQERDPGYLVRCHQHYARLLEERSTGAPERGKETSRALVALLENRLFEFQNAIISAQIPGPDVAQK